jgi:hypothetical protein
VASESDSVALGGEDGAEAIADDLVAPGELGELDMSTPWNTGCFRSDIARLEIALTKILVNGDWPGSSGGGLGKALDRWVADQLYRAGYDSDSVWPRREKPLQVPLAVIRAAERLPSKKKKSDPIVAEMILMGRRTMGPRPALIGEFYSKQFDVLVADWDRGVELLVSTKGMTKSFSNNLINRWEEFVGEIRNVRGRYPLATVGALFLADSAILKQPAMFDRTKDMLRKLRSRPEDRGAFDTTGLLIAERRAGRVVIRQDDVESDLSPDCFFYRLLRSVFDRMPVSERVRARELYAASLAGLQPPALDGVPAGEAPCGCDA